MKTTTRNPSGAPSPVGNYSQGLDVTGFSRLLFVSGQIAETAGSEVPADFEAQCRQVWANIAAVLEDAGLGFDNLVKVTTILTDRDQAEANRRIRHKVLGERRPALTVMVAQTLEPAWLLEIEAVAAA